ncbi:hypothetical protein BMS3Bbin04_01392 [bacterium BMS3Bbin04]|nr:hypothetical protein BMS3Bbin04_01392 [bacterium BMS3Bbin04]
MAENRTSDNNFGLMMIAVALVIAALLSGNQCVDT